MNGYTYADNNPVMTTDPDGHKRGRVKGKDLVCNESRAKAGAKAVYNSYSSIGKALSLSVGFSIDILKEI